MSSLIRVRAKHSRTNIRDFSQKILARMLCPYSPYSPYSPWLAIGFRIRVQIFGIFHRRWRRDRTAPTSPTSPGSSLVGDRVPHSRTNIRDFSQKIKPRSHCPYIPYRRGGRGCSKGLKSLATGIKPTNRWVILFAPRSQVVPEGRWECLSRGCTSRHCYIMSA